MKFQLLPIGARFEFEGKVYTKTGPVQASSNEGGSRMIPRYARLKLLDGTPSPAKSRPIRKLDETMVLDAFETFYEECLRQLDEPAKLQLEAAKARFLAEPKWL